LFLINTFAFVTEQKDVSLVEVLSSRPGIIIQLLNVLNPQWFLTSKTSMDNVSGAIYSKKGIDMDT
jgi:hypothetical protein